MVGRRSLASTTFALRVWPAQRERAFARSPQAGHERSRAPARSSYGRTRAIAASCVRGRRISASFPSPSRSRRAPQHSRSCDDAHGTPRWPARRRRPRSADRPSAAAHRSSCEFAPSRRDRRRPRSSSSHWARIPRPASPARAGTSMAIPRAWPSLSVADPLALTKVVSTAASSGRNSSDTPCQSIVDRHQPLRQLGALAGFHRAAGDEDQAGCRQPRSGPSRCGGAPDRCRGCESDARPWPR